MRILGILAAVILLATACGDDSDDSAGGSATTVASATGALAAIDMSGQDIKVGSKDFVEQFVLGEILMQALAATGAKTTDFINTGGTSVVRTAMLNGEIDAYWEYTGTGWVVHLGREDPSDDPETLYEELAVADRDENGVEWVGRSQFNNTYGYATSPEFAEENPGADGGPMDLFEMADYMESHPDATLCLDTEFPFRGDGQILWEEATGYTVPESQKVILGDPGIIFAEIANGSCTFGLVFTTDGRIPALDLVLVEDPGVFIIYNASVTLPAALYDEKPEEWDAIVALILENLDQDTMSELNRQVSVEGEEASDVAAQFLKDSGLT